MKLFYLAIHNKIKGLIGYNPSIFIFLTAFSVNTLIALFYNNSFISSDGKTFQKIAVNICNGKGYSAEDKDPYTPYFFREPGYPVFFTFACWINEKLGNENVKFENLQQKDNHYTGFHGEIVVLRLLQGFILAVSVLLFYKILNFYLTENISRTISFLLCFYLPFCVFTTFPLREPLVVFLLMLSNYLLLKSAFSDNKFILTILTGIVIGFATLTFQGYFLVIPFYLITFYLISKSISGSVRWLITVTIFFILTIFPWINRTYNYYNDIRILKSVGTCYTYELKDYLYTNYKAYQLNLDDGGYPFRDRIVDEYWKEGKIIFNRSFYGYYKHQVDSLNLVINTIALDSKNKRNIYSLKNIISVNLRKSLIWPLWKPDYTKSISELILKDKNIPFITLYVLSIIIFLLAISGIFFTIKKTWIYIPVFTFHFLLIPFIADEGRRVLPFLPFYFMFFILSLYIIQNKIKKEKAYQIFVK